MDKKKRAKILGGIVAVLLLGIAVFFGNRSKTWHGKKYFR